MTSDITYQLENELTAAEFINILQRSTLAERRPVDDLERVEGMLRHADVIITARCDGELVGVSRAVTDFSFCTYLSDLAVDVQRQRQGIGRTLIDKTHEAAGRHTKLVLIAAPAAVNYYPRIGMEKHDSCWMISDAPVSGRENE